MQFQLWPGSRTLSFLTTKPQTPPPPPPLHISDRSLVYRYWQKIFMPENIFQCVWTYPKTFISYQATPNVNTPHPRLTTSDLSLDYIYGQKIYKAGNIFQCVWAYLFTSAFKVSVVDVGVGVVCLSTLVLIWRDISAFVIFDSKSHKIPDNWSFIKIEVVWNDGCGDTCVGFILYACL